MIGYNRITGYNKARYNAEGVEIQVNDSFTVTDSTVTKSGRKTATELLVLSESIAKQQNKSVTDSIRLDDWTRKNKQEPNRWSD